VQSMIYILKFSIFELRLCSLRTAI